MTSNGGSQITVFYKIVNSEGDRDGLYNAFQMPSNGGLTLASIKRYGAAFRVLNHMGADGFHWRVCVPEKREGGTKEAFSWWDIQDENAKLPVKDYSMAQLESMFMPQKPPAPVISATDTASKAAKGALKGLGKAMSAAVGAVETPSDTGPRVSAIAFKILDLVKMNDDYTLKSGGSRSHGPIARISAPKTARKPARPAPSAHRTPAPARAHQQTARAAPQQQQQQQQQQQTRARPAPKPVAEASLMDFGDAPTTSHGSGMLHHSSSVQKSTPRPNETRAERLKREYEQKQQKANRVWDDVDQRWVEVDPKKGMKMGSTSAPPGADSSRPSTQKKAVGITLDPANAVGKSATVQAAVNARVNEMKQSQQKAVEEIRQREAAKKMNEAQEDEVRKRLEPKIRAWSEEYGRKKQLRALLATLHTILWPGANWKQVSIGDLMNEAKVKKAFFKASRVVHPDKTGDLDAEKRFLAKRIFDALSQAKTEFDSGSK